MGLNPFKLKAMLIFTYNLVLDNSHHKIGIDPQTTLKHCFFIIVYVYVCAGVRGHTCAGVRGHTHALACAQRKKITEEVCSPSYHMGLRV